MAGSYRLDPGAEAPVPITPAGPWRYADLRPDLARRRFYAVREDHTVRGRAGQHHRHHPARRRATRRCSSRAPISSPRRACRRTATRLAWLEWDHPDMPWDATLLKVAAFEADGTLGEAMLAAGGPDESIVQPEWAPDGTLHLISDRSGWWNLYRLVDGPRLEPLAAMEAEFADPAWIFDRSSYGFLRRRRRRGRRPRAAAATTSSGSSRAPASASWRSRSPSSTGCRSGRMPSSPSPAGRATRPSSPASTR